MKRAWIAGALAVTTAIVAIAVFFSTRGPIPGEVVKSPLPRPKEVREIFAELDDVPPIYKKSAEFRVPEDLREEVMRFFEGKTYVKQALPKELRKDWSMGTIRLVITDKKQVEIQFFMGGKGGTTYRVGENFYIAEYLDDDGGTSLALLLNWVRRNRPTNSPPSPSTVPSEAGSADSKSGSLTKSHSSPSAP